ncbi:hypothetical protein V2A60_009777 [Cordyceps javanica]
MAPFQRMRGVCHDKHRYLRNARNLFGRRLAGPKSTATVRRYEIRRCLVGIRFSRCRRGRAYRRWRNRRRAPSTMEQSPGRSGKTTPEYYKDACDIFSNSHEFYRDPREFPGTLSVATLGQLRSLDSQRHERHDTDKLSPWDRRPTAAEESPEYLMSMTQQFYANMSDEERVRFFLESQRRGNQHRANLSPLEHRPEAGEESPEYLADMMRQFFRESPEDVSTPSATPASDTTNSGAAAQQADQQPAAQDSQAAVSNETYVIWNSLPQASTRSMPRAQADDPFLTRETMAIVDDIHAVIQSESALSAMTQRPPARNTSESSQVFAGFDAFGPEF